MIPVAAIPVVATRGAAIQGVAIPAGVTPGRGDPGRGDPGAPPDQGDLTLDHASAIFNGPYALTARTVGKTVELRWLPPHLLMPGVHIVSTTAYRVQGNAITPANWANRVAVGQAFGQATTLLDTKPLSKKPVIYIVVVEFTGGARSGISNLVSFIYP